MSDLYNAWKSWHSYILPKYTHNSTVIKLGDWEARLDKLLFSYLPWLIIVMKLLNLLLDVNCIILTLHWLRSIDI